MATEAWQLEGAAIGEGDEVANSVADRLVNLKTAVDGLDTSDLAEVLEEVVEIERHLHSRGYWYGKDPGDTFLLANGLTAWQLTAGAGGAFGNWVQLSNGDEVSDPYYDPHLMFVKAASANGKLYYVQFGTGESGAQVVSGMAAFFPAATLRQSPVQVQHTRIASTVKWWARANCETDGATIDIVVGLHTYLE